MSTSTCIRSMIVSLHGFVKLNRIIVTVRTVMSSKVPLSRELFPHRVKHMICISRTAHSDVFFSAPWTDERICPVSSGCLHVQAFHLEILYQLRNKCNWQQRCALIHENIRARYWAFLGASRTCIQFIHFIFALTYDDDSCCCIYAWCRSKNVKTKNGSNTKV